MGPYQAKGIRANDPVSHFQQRFQRTSL